jgi:flagellar hook-associated protein 1 FlgK
VDAGLSIAASGLNASMAEIDVAAENLSNSQTPGYVAQTAQLSTLPGGGQLGVGDGVLVTSVSQVNSAMLSANNLQAQGSLSNISSLQQVLTGIEDVFPLGQTTAAASTASTNSSIAGELSTFWSAWDSVAQDPSGSAPRTQIVNMAQGIATSLHEASTQLDQLATNTSSSLQTDVGQVNTLLSQAASLNGTIIQTTGGGQSSNQLADQLNNVLGQLSSLAGVNVQMQANGTAQISLGGINVLQGNQAATLSTTPPSGTATSTTTTIYAYPPAATGSLVGSAEGVAAPVSSGALAGLLSGVNQYIPKYQAQLDSVATALASTVNTQLASGYTASGVSGSTEPLFTSTGPMSAGTITVNAAVVADPTLIAAAGANSTGTGPIGANDGSNAQAMAERGTVSTGPDLTYQNLVEGIGSDTQNANTQLTSQTAVANQAQQALQSVTGVNQDAQLAALMQFQANYQASAKVVSVIDATMQSLLAAV